MRVRLHKGPKQDCPRCADALRGLEATFQLLEGKPKKHAVRTDSNDGDARSPRETR